MGPVYTRPMTEEEKEYFRKRKEQLKKQSKKIPRKKNWKWPSRRAERKDE